MVSFLILLVILGFGAYLVERFVPMSEPFQLVFRVVLVAAVFILLLDALGYLSVRRW